MKIVVTGCASGIGAQTAQALMDQGHEIIGIDRNPAATIPTAIQADLSTPEGVADALAQLPDRIDGLCNIAGLPGTAAPEITMAVNVQALRDLCLGVAERMQPGGSIVNLASLAGSQWRKRLDDVRTYLAFPERGEADAWFANREDLRGDAYRFSKECVIVLTGQLADQFIPAGIRVNSVSPGPVETPIFEDFKQSLGRQMIQDAVDLVGRAATPADVEPVVSFLVSEPARWINGIDIPVDGGLGAHRLHGKVAGQ